MSWIGEAATQARRKPWTVALVVAVLLSSVFSSTAVLAQRRTQQDLRGVIHDQQVAAVRERADRCVTSWNTREDIRDAIEKGGRAPTSAITRLVVEMGQDTSFLDRLSQLSEEEIAAARGEIDDPGCDRDEAQHLLDDPAAVEAAVDQ